MAVVLICLQGPVVPVHSPLPRLPAANRALYGWTSIANVVVLHNSVIVALTHATKRTQFVHIRRIHLNFLYIPSVVVLGISNLHLVLEVLLSFGRISHQVTLCRTENIVL